VADHSRRCRAPAPSAPPCPASEHARVGFSYSSSH
jgi:hypothetical protein